MRHMLISPKHWPSDILMEILTIDHDHNGSWSMDIVNNTYTCIYNTMYFLGLKTPPTLTLNPSCQDQILASFRGPLASISLSFKWRPLQHLSLYEHFLIYSRLSSLFLVCPVNCVCVRDDSTKSWILDAREKRSLFFFFFFFSGQVGFWGLVLFQKSNCIENKQKGTDPEYHVEPLTHREINDYCLKCC